MSKDTQKKRYKSKKKGLQNQMKMPKHLGSILIKWRPVPCIEAYMSKIGQKWTFLSMGVYC